CEKSNNHQPRHIQE
nr:immunoglobulin heavy chain junction region [Homo sapiens]